MVCVWFRRMWRGQFWLSFGSNCGLAVLFFLGALVGQDHTPGRQAGRQHEADFAYPADAHPPFDWPRARGNRVNESNARLALSDGLSAWLPPPCGVSVPSPPPPPPPSWLPRLLAQPWCWLYSVLHSDLFDVSDPHPPPGCI